MITAAVAFASARSNSFNPEALFIGTLIIDLVIVLKVLRLFG